MARNILGESGTFKRMENGVLFDILNHFFNLLVGTHDFSKLERTLNLSIYLSQLCKVQQ